MFLRTVRVPAKGDAVYEYLRLVEAYRENGQRKHRTVLNLGRKDLLAPHVDRLVELLTGEAPDHLHAEDVEPVAAWDWGPVLALRSLWRELDLDAILDRLEPPRDQGRWENKFSL